MLSVECAAAEVVPDITSSIFHFPSDITNARLIIFCHKEADGTRLGIFADTAKHEVGGLGSLIDIETVVGQLHIVGQRRHTLSPRKYGGSQRLLPLGYRVSFIFAT